MDCGYEQQDTQVGTAHDEAKFHHKFVQGIDLKFPTCEKQKKKKQRKHTPKKKSHAQDNIYVVRKFAICLRPRSCKNFTIIREKYKMLLQCFSLSKNDNNDNNKTLITKNVFYILRTGPSLYSMD